MKPLSRIEEILLLSILKLADEAYGVSIREQILKDIGETWSFASIYQPLDKLVRKEYVKKIKGEPTAERGGKSKFYYEVTRNGKEVLLAVRKTHDQVWARISNIALENGK